MNDPEGRRLFEDTRKELADLRFERKFDLAVVVVCGVFAPVIWIAIHWAVCVVWLLVGAWFLKCYIDGTMEARRVRAAYIRAVMEHRAR